MNTGGNAPIGQWKIHKRITPGSGALQFFEGERDIPFAIKRVYYITNAPRGTNRGMHAHKELKQFLFCPYGSIKLILDDGVGKQEILLDRPDVGVLITPCVWRDMVWLRDDSVLCVAASDYYDEGDYIRDYDAFGEYIGGMQNEG